jgi:hypothetical protein
VESNKILNKNIIKNSKKPTTSIPAQKGNKKITSTSKIKKRTVSK